MYVVKKTESQISAANVAGFPHHPVFGHFSCWSGNVPEGFIVNFLGAMTRVGYFESYLEISRQYPADRHVETEFPLFDEEYFEWIDLLEAIVRAEGHFTMLELGAGYGRWTANAAVALRRLKDLPQTFVAVEAEPTHFQWMVQHFADNSVDAKNLQLVEAAVADADGKVGLHLKDPEWGGPSTWYGQSVGGSHPVDAIALETLLRPLGTVDLIDIDVQGAELRVLEAAAEALDEKVKRIHIGTHGPDIEAGLHSLFARLGWMSLRSFPCGATANTEWGTIYFQDGVQTWLNPTYSDPPRNKLSVVIEKLEASRREGARLWQELEMMRQERQRVQTVDPASLAWKILVTGGRLRDQTAPAGTRRRKMLQFIAKKFSNSPDAPREPASSSISWEKPYETLRKKWVNVPVTTLGRMKTTDLLALPDQALLEQWERAREEITTGWGFPHRGWYHALYADGMHGKKLMDVGSGFGIDSITFAQHGARLTFVDLVESNLMVLERLCKIMGLQGARFHVLKDVDSLKTLDTDYDVIMAMGSMHNAPVEVMKPEYHELIRHLKVGGRWLQLAYPKSRWIRDGSPSFEKWGPMVDGPGTPWEEWYDIPKLLTMFEPAKFDVVLYQEFHNSDFNWFDLLYRGEKNGHSS
jgi:FkbM family methyltransferase